MDYKDTTAAHTLHAYLIPPTNLDDIYEEMTGIDWSSLSIDCGYYTDARVSATFTAVNDNYIPGAYIRIVEETQGTETELGTFAVNNDQTDNVNGADRRSFVLISQLHGLSLGYCPDSMVLGAGSLALTAFGQTLKEGGKDEQDSITNDANDYRLSTSQVLEPGASRLSRLYEIANMSGNRLDVDGHGRVTLKKYQTPDSRSPILRLSQDDERGIIIDGITHTSNWGEVIDNYILAYDYTTTDGDKTTSHHMFAVARNSQAPARGYTVSEYETISELSPQTQTNLTRLAKERAVKNSNEKNEWNFSMKYIPGLWEGDVIELETVDADERHEVNKCLVKSMTITGPYLDTEITLKATSGGDDE